MVFVALADIPASTTISFTDNAWNATTQAWRTSEGTIEWSTSSVVSAGTVITITFGIPYTVDVGSVTNITGFNLSTSGDQVLSYLGTTAPTSNDAATWLYGFSLENFVWGDNANSSDIPAALASYSVAMTTSTTEIDNAYFANGSAAQTSVSVSGTKAELLTLFTDASKYYLNNTGPLAFPTYTITVTAGSTPTISVNTTSLTGFTYVVGSGPSTSQNYDLSGTNLTPASGNLTVTGSTNYEVSTDNSTFGSSVNVAYTSSTLASATIYVRLKAGLGVGTYNGETISNAGGGAITQNVAVSGNVTALPLPLVENFDYTAGELLTDNGWIAHSGEGTEAVTVNNGGLEYTSYPSSNIGNAALLDNTGEDISKLFGTVSTGIVYYSFLVNVTTGTAGYFTHLGSSATTFAARIFVKPSTTTDKINFGISNTSTASYAATPTDFDLLTTYLVIVKYDVSTTGDASLWVLSSGVPISEAAAGTPEHTTTASGLATIERVCLRQYSSSQNLIVDGIRVATSWTEAPLPVELTSFSASVIGTAVKLSWRTETETNNYGFEVERKVDRPQSSVSNPPTGEAGYEKLGFVDGYGTSNSPKDYSFTDASVVSGTYSYRLKQIDIDGTSSYSKTIEVDLGAPKKYELAQNFPNPFNPNTAIKFTLPETGNVKLTVYNMLGQEIAILVNGVKEAGTHIVNFNAEELNSGIYLYCIESNGFNKVRKMTLIK